MSGDAEVFRGLSPLLRVRPELQHICRFGAQWASPHAPEAPGWAAFHLVTRGGCMLDVAGQPRITLGAGDIAVLPHGGPHTVRALSEAGPARPPIRTHARAHDALTVKTNVDGEPDTELVCGRLFFEQAHGNLVRAALPATTVLRAAADRDGPRLRPVLRSIGAELAEDRLGAVEIACTLATSLMMVVLRRHLEQQPHGTGLPALLSRPQTARALAAMLKRPAHPWTLDALAAEAVASRATLVRMFQRATGAAPLGFLHGLRLTLARSRLVATDAALAMVAAEAGYGSEAAFSRAYHRHFGRPPGADRREGLEGRNDAPAN